MPRKNVAQQPDTIESEQIMTESKVCKAVDCAYPVMDNSEYCATHHSENEALKEKQTSIKFNTDVFTLEGETLLTQVKHNSVSQLVDVVIEDGYIKFPLPGIAYFKTDIPKLTEDERKQLQVKVPYHIIQGKKGASKLSLSIERIEQHRDHLIGAYIDMVNAVRYIEDGAPRTTNKAVASNTKKDMLDKMPQTALVAWAASLGIADDLDRDEMIKEMLSVI